MEAQSSVSKISASQDSGVTMTIGNMPDGMFMARSISATQSVFAGVGQNSVFERMVGTDQEETIELLTRAVNNRTRQRNYFRLFSEMLQGNISEDDFDNAIDANPDDYVLSEQEVPSRDKLLKALRLSRQIMDVNNTEDISMLFSFDSEVTDHVVKLLESHADIH